MPKILYVNLGSGKWLELTDSGHPQIISTDEEIQGEPATWSIPPHIANWLQENGITVRGNQITGIVC